MRPFPYVHPALALSPCVPVPPASDGNGFTMLLEPRDQFSPKLMLFCARRRPPPPPPPPGPPMTKGPEPGPPASPKLSISRSLTVSELLAADVTQWNFWPAAVDAR